MNWTSETTKRPPTNTLNYRQIALRLVGLTLTVTVGIRLLSSGPAQQADLAPNKNKLLLSSAVALRNIGNGAPVNLSGRTVAEVMKWRKQRVDLMPELFEGSYEPSSAVFSRLKDGAPWFSTVGMYYIGLSEESGSGQSALSESIASPFQLVIPHFWGLSIWDTGKLKWNKSRVSTGDIESGKIPSRPRSTSVMWNPSAGEAETTYKVNEFLQGSAPYLEKPLTLQDIDFGVSAFNARDLNLRFISMDMKNSIGLESPRPVEAIERIVDYLGYQQGDCGLSAGCNHERGLPRQLNLIKVTALPATAVFKLWMKQPENGEVKADLIFTIHLE